MTDQKSAQFPFEFKELDPEEKAETNKLYGRPKDLVSVGPKKYIVFRAYEEDAANIYNMPLRNSDIFVVTYQRSGTTWVQELVWLIENNFDYETAKAVNLVDRYKFLEFFMFYGKEWKEDYLKNAENKENALAVIEKLGNPVTDTLLTMPSPRFIKTHLPMSLLPPTLLDTAKVVYVARDPRDVAVSSYHHSRLFKYMHCPNSLKGFWKLFIKDLFVLTPIFEHIKEAWEMRHHPNMLFLFYEELAKDLPATIHRVAEFLGKEVTTKQMTRLCDHLNIENFKNNCSVNFEQGREEYGDIMASDETFIRKGKVGGWRDCFDEEMTWEGEQWIADNLRDTDLRFPHIYN